MVIRTISVSQAGSYSDLVGNRISGGLATPLSPCAEWDEKLRSGPPLLAPFARSGKCNWSGSAQLFHNIADECLRVAEEHQRLVHVVKRIINASETGIHTALDHHHGVGLFYIQD